MNMQTTIPAVVLVADATGGISRWFRTDAAPADCCDVAQAVAALRERKPVMVCEGDADTVRALLAAMERMTQ